MKKGFTLIELLAVIVILAIIALIATPIILNIINSSKESSNQRRIELYAIAVENAVAKYSLTGQPNTGIYKSSNDGKILTNGSTTLNVEYSGNKVECEINEIRSNGTVYLDECSIDGNKIEYTYGIPPVCNSVTSETKTAGKVPNGNYNYGDEYICNVDGKNKYHFFILSTEGDNINLIMNRNICDNGTLATSSNDCLVEWINQADYSNDAVYGSSGKTDKGPITAMNYLYSATKKWTNIPNINIDYTNEYTNKYDYKGIKTEKSITSIISKDGIETVTYKNLKARMPYISELQSVGCKDSTGSCPAWIIEYLKYNEYIETNTLEINGYWTLTANNGVAHFVYYTGWVPYNSVKIEYGVRPVITINKADVRNYQK